MRWMIEEQFLNGKFSEIRDDVIKLHNEEKSIDDIVDHIIKEYYVLGDINSKADIREHIRNILNNRIVVDKYAGKVYNSLTELSKDPDKNKKNPYSITLEDRQKLYDKEFNELMQIPKEQLVCMLIGLRPI